MLVIRGTQRFRDRVPDSVAADDDRSTGELGDWYATVLRWRPAVALMVNETTLLPVLLPLAPARTMTARLPDAVAQLLAALDVPDTWVRRELAQMSPVRLAPTANRSAVGVMNEFAFLAGAYRSDRGAQLPVVSRRLAGTPCGPLRATHGFPDRALAALVATGRSSSSTRKG